MTKKSASTEKTLPSESQFSCGYCGRHFKRESTINTHVCEQKRRWLEKDRPGNRIAFASFTRFYKFNTSSKTKTHDDFVKSSYYLAFVKFGNYCAEAKVIGVERYVDWLLKNQIKLADWPSDTHYKRYLIEFLRHENPLDAVARSVETLIELSDATQLQACDYLRWGSVNRVCQQITNGKISPWLLYHSESGIKFLDTLNEDQLKMVFEYINPELWALQFKRNPEGCAEVKQLLQKGGF